MIDYIIGIDVGQTHDFTAITVLERRTASEDALPVHHARHIERLPTGTPYPRQVERAAELVRGVEAQALERFPRAGVRVVVDQTGVGRPVVDLLRRAVSAPVVGVTIHGGDATTRDGLDYRVPKRELVSVLQVLLQTGRLRIAEGLPLAQLLASEMQAFRVRVSAAGHDSYGNDWREAEHDDLVLAVALAAWHGEQPERITSARVAESFYR